MNSNRFKQLLESKMGNVRPLISEEIDTENVYVNTLIGYLAKEGGKYNNLKDAGPDFTERGSALMELTRYLYDLRDKKPVKKENLSKIAQEIYTTLINDVNSLSVEDRMKYYEFGRTLKLLS